MYFGSIKTPRPGSRTGAFGSLLIAATLLAGCMQPADTGMINLPPAEPAPGLNDATGAAPLISPVAAGYGAQRQLLPNATSLQGENFLLTMPGDSLFGPKSAERILQDAEPLPYPFEFVIAQDLQPVNGVGGSLGYTSNSPVPGTTCVLVAGQGGISYGSSTAILMRNCVNGDVDEALSPLRTY